MIDLKQVVQKTADEIILSQGLDRARSQVVLHVRMAILETLEKVAVHLVEHADGFQHAADRPGIPTATRDANGYLASELRAKAVQVRAMKIEV